jgi:hypothetical protein
MQAVAELDAALEMMDEIEKRGTEGSMDKDTEAVYKWMMGESADLDRTRYLKAVAFAVIARAGGNHTKADVVVVLDSISPAYRRSYPPDDNPDLRWARRVPLTINAVREGTGALAPTAMLTLWDAQGSLEQEAVPFPGGKAQLQVLPGQHFLSAVGGVQRWPIEVQEPETAITVRVSAAGELKGISAEAATDQHSAPMTPLLWIGLGFVAVLVVFLMVTYYAPITGSISPAAYNNLRFLTSLCAGFAGALITGEVFLHWEQQLPGGAKVGLSAAAGAALLALVWLTYPRPPKPPASRSRSS